MESGQSQDDLILQMLRTLMDISFGIVRSLVRLVESGIFGGRGTRSEACIGVLSNILVGLLGSSSPSALNGLRDAIRDVLRMKCYL